VALAKAGAQVLVHYGSGEKQATAVVAEIQGAGGRSEIITADLRAGDGPHLLAEPVRGIIGGRLAVLVANAGISRAASIAEMTIEDFDALFAVKRAPYFLVQQLLPVMCKGSSVILLTSLAAHAAVKEASPSVGSSRRS